nr:hypothetical protein CFP56_72055 [Quercus suber]
MTRSTKSIDLVDLERQSTSSTQATDGRSIASPDVQAALSASATSPVPLLQRWSIGKSRGHTVERSSNTELFKKKYSGINGQVLLLAFDAGKHGVRAIEVPVYRPSDVWIRNQDFVQSALAKIDGKGWLGLIRQEENETIARLRRDEQYEDHQDIWIRIKKAWYNEVPIWQRFIPLWRPIALQERGIELYDRQDSLYEVELQAEINVMASRENAQRACKQLRQNYDSPCIGYFDTFGHWHHNGTESCCVAAGRNAKRTMSTCKSQESVYNRREVDMVISALLTTLVVLIWKLATGDWSTAAGFGSLVVALITLAAMRSQRSDGKLLPLFKRRK